MGAWSGSISHSPIMMPVDRHFIQSQNLNCTLSPLLKNRFFHLIFQQTKTQEAICFVLLSFLIRPCLVRLIKHADGANKVGQSMDSSWPSV